MSTLSYRSEFSDEEKARVKNLNTLLTMFDAPALAYLLPSNKVNVPRLQRPFVMAVYSKKNIDRYGTLDELECAVKRFVNETVDAD